MEKCTQRAFFNLSVDSKKLVLHVTLVCESLTDGMERKRIKVKK